jgi:hypothetical protein
VGSVPSRNSGGERKSRQRLPFRLNLKKGDQKEAEGIGQEEKEK